MAAVFLATGQDPAHTVEGSNCITLMEEIKHGDTGAGRPGDLRVTVTLPSLLVGTVGGGTGLAAQAACLRLMGIPAQVAGAGGGRVGSRISKGEGGGGAVRGSGGFSANVGADNDAAGVYAWFLLLMLPSVLP